MENQGQRGLSHYRGILLLSASERDPAWVRAWFVVEVRAESVVEGEWAVEELLGLRASVCAPIAGIRRSIRPVSLAIRDNAPYVEQE